MQKEEQSRLYVCEWVKKDISFMENNEMFSILSTYDYTYHITLTSAQYISSLNWKGYSHAKGITANLDDFIEPKSFHNKIHSEIIWVYENNFSIGRYVLQSGSWIYDAYAESWHQNWEEMIMIPTPKI